MTDIATDGMMQGPNVDAMASGGVVLENHFAAAPTCSPSRASMVTGLVPHRHGLMGLQNHALWNMDPAIPTIASLLRDGGYQTACFGTWHVNDRPYVASSFMNTFWNTYGFFVLYARLDDVDFDSELAVESRPEIDRWALALLNRTTRVCTEALDRYDVKAAGEAISDAEDRVYFMRWFAGGNWHGLQEG